LVFWGELIATLLHAASTSGIRALTMPAQALSPRSTGYRLCDPPSIMETRDIAATKSVLRWLRDRCLEAAQL
jgi:hypothetical protein